MTEIVSFGVNELNSGWDEGFSDIVGATEEAIMKQQSIKMGWNDTGGTTKETRYSEDDESYEVDETVRSTVELR